MKRWRYISILLTVFIAFPASFSGSKGSVATQGGSNNFFEGAERVVAEREVKRLMRIQARHQPAMMTHPGVIGFGIGVNSDTRQLVYRIFMDEDEPIASIASMPATIEGVPLEVERRQPMVAINGGDGCIPCHSEQLSLPVQMGNSTSFDLACHACTLGFKARDLDTGQLVYMTAGHCAIDATFCPASAPIGTMNFHRSTGDNGCSLAGLLNIGALADRAFPTLGDANIDAAEIISSDAQTSSAIRDIGTPSAIPATVLPGDLVQKSGRTTGLTFDTVRFVNLSNLITFSCGSSVFNGLIFFEAGGGCSNPPCASARPGDSGSAVLTRANPPQIVGLLISATPDGLFGGVVPIASILNRFNLTLDLSQGASFNICLQDESDSTKVAFMNSSTGDYLFSCNGDVVTGRGKMTIKGNSFTLQHNAPDRRVLIKVDESVHKGTANLQTPPGTIKCSIVDRNTQDNTCNSQ